MNVSDFKSKVRQVWLALSIVAHLISVPLATIELWLVIGGRPSIAVPAILPSDRPIQIAANVRGT